MLWAQIQGRGLGRGFVRPRLRVRQARARVRQAGARRVGQLLLEMRQAVGRHECTREELAGRLVGGLGDDHAKEDLERVLRLVELNACLAVGLVGRQVGWVGG